MRLSAGPVNGICPREDELSYLREFEHITLARVLLAQYGAERAERFLDEATRLLERLLDAAEAGGRAGSVIEILVAAGARPPGARGPPRCAGPLGSGADAGRAGGLRSASSSTRGHRWPPCCGRPRNRDRRSYVRRLLAADHQDAGRPPAAAGLDRAAQRTRTGRAPAARNRSGRTGDRPRAGRVAEHRPDAHQEHLRQARRQQPPSSGPPGRGARPLARVPATADPGDRTGRITRSITTCGDACLIRSGSTFRSSRAPSRLGPAAEGPIHQGERDDHHRNQHQRHEPRWTRCGRPRSSGARST